MDKNRYVEAFIEAMRLNYNHNVPSGNVYALERTANGGVVVVATAIPCSITHELKQPQAAVRVTLPCQTFKIRYLSFSSQGDDEEGEGMCCVVRQVGNAQQCLRESLESDE